jgi:formamidopyrimidine-DNA glycosylase
LVGSTEELEDLDPGGLDPLSCSREAFVRRLGSGRWTLKRALTDPRNLAGIGNAYSDEILFQARLSPVTLTSALSPEAWERLHLACRDVLVAWTERLRREAGDAFPKRVTAFHELMAVHGRFRQPCRACGDPIQRIVRAENEVNYCATCQTGGRLLADRALSTLLKAEWPRSLDAWEERRQRLSAPTGGPDPASLAEQAPGPDTD